MNKLLILIIVLIVAGIGVCFFSQKPAFPQPSPIQKTGENISKDSPFGAHGAISRPFIESDKVSSEEVIKRISELKEPYKHVEDIGIKWVRPGADIYWPMVQPTPEHIKNSLFEWKDADAFFGRVPPGVNILATIDALPWDANVHPAFKPGTWEFSREAAEKDYIKFVKEVVERYDGDGIKDMPGLKNPIKYWQVGNEPAVRPLLGIKDLTKNMDSKGFSHLVEITYKAIKDSDPEAKVALAGMAGGYHMVYTNDPLARRERDEFYIPILQNLHGRYVDIFDIHYYGFSPEESGWKWEGMKDVHDFFRRLLDQNGYKDTEIWFTETAVTSKLFGEKFQAINLFKRYIYPLSFGVKKIFWWNMIEGEFPLEDDQPSDHFGLVYDGIGKDDPGYGVKKLSYYTYKKMVEILQGSDWNNIKTIQEKDSIYVYKFTKQGKSIWIVWNDNPQQKQITISSITSKQVKITEAIPKYESGKDIKNYYNAFETDVKTVNNGRVTIAIGENPVFVEEK